VAPTDLAGAVQYAAQGLKLVLVPDADSRDLRTLLAAAGTPQALPPITLLVGPEGGLDPGELRIARLAGFASCRLGPRVLRTETAALVALAVLQFAAGDLAHPG